MGPGVCLEPTGLASITLSLRGAPRSPPRHCSLSLALRPLSEPGQSPHHSLCPEPPAGSGCLSLWPSLRRPLGLAHCTRCSWNHSWWPWGQGPARAVTSLPSTWPRGPVCSPSSCAGQLPPSGTPPGGPVQCACPLSLGPGQGQLFQPHGATRGAVGLLSAPSALPAVAHSATLCWPPGAGSGQHRVEPPGHAGFSAKTQPGTWGSWLGPPSKP